MGYKAFTKMFESCVCPVMEYSSGVWGYKEFKVLDNVQNRAARVFLGVHRFVPIVGMEGEIGWLLTKFRMWLNILRHWNKLVELPETRTTKHVFINDFYLACSNFDNWCMDVFNIASAIGEEEVFYNRGMFDIDDARKKLYVIQEERWKHDIMLKPKLRFYRMFKSELKAFFFNPTSASYQSDSFVYKRSPYIL